MVPALHVHILKTRMFHKTQVGHNWNLAHASQQDEVCEDVDDEECMEYGDQSGQMGYGAWENEQIEGLKFCFNGARKFLGLRCSRGIGSLRLALTFVSMI